MTRVQETIIKPKPGLLAQADALSRAWQRLPRRYDYNTIKPHSSAGNQSKKAWGSYSPQAFCCCWHAMFRPR